MYLTSFLPLGFVLAATAQSVTEVIARNPDISSLNDLLKGQPGIVSALNNAQNITVLAPSNAAFEAFLKSPDGSAAATQPDVVANLLTYHVLTGAFKASAFSEVPVFPRTLLTNTSYTTLKDGQRVKVELDDSSVIVTSGLLATSRVTSADIGASNGVIHIIDKVLTIPAPISDTAVAASLDSLMAALKKVNLVETVDNLPAATVFAPDNEAFEDASNSTANLNDEQLKKVLTYHVLDNVKYSSDLKNGLHLKTLNGDEIHVDNKNDDSIYVNSVEIDTLDILVSNGVVHVIEEVLLSSGSGKNGAGHSDHDHDTDDKDDHDGHDDKNSTNSAAVPGFSMNKHVVISIGTLILAQLFAL